MRVNRMDRRAFLAGATALAASPRLTAHAASSDAAPSRPLIAFIKFVQSLDYETMARRVAALGFDGVESTVRRGGHVSPDRVKEDLPRQVEAVRRHGMDVTIMTTDVLQADDPLTQDVLRTGASLGLKTYRMGFYRYDTSRGVMEQLAEIRPRLRELAQLNRELGLTAVYQNHSGSDFVGAPIWDLRYLLDGIDPAEVGVAFDIRHATIEGGLSWPLEWRLIEPHVGALFVKDYRWEGKKAEHCPLGEGRVDKRFFTDDYIGWLNCPVSVHVEYLKDGGAEENLAALDRDLRTLKKWLAA